MKDQSYKTAVICKHKCQHAAQCRINSPCCWERMHVTPLLDARGTECNLFLHRLKRPFRFFLTGKRLNVGLYGSPFVCSQRWAQPAGRLHKTGSGEAACPIASGVSVIVLKRAKLCIAWQLYQPRPQVSTIVAMQQPPAGNVRTPAKPGQVIADCCRALIRQLMPYALLSSRVRLAIGAGVCKGSCNEHGLPLCIPA